MTDKEMLDVIKATLYLSDSQIDAKALMSDVKRQVTLNWEREESEFCEYCAAYGGYCGSCDGRYWKANTYA